MSDNNGVQVVGADQAFRDIDRIVKRIQEGAETVAVNAATRLSSLVASEVPYQSGNLAGSLSTLVVKNGRAVGYDTSRAPYAGWIEFGGTRGRPYIREGRYLFRSGALAAPMFVDALTREASRQIRGFPWSKQ